MEDIIKTIHNDCNAIYGVLFLRGNVNGSDLEKIVELWDGDVHVETLIGNYKHNGKHPLTVANNNGFIDTSNL